MAWINKSIKQRIQYSLINKRQLNIVCCALSNKYRKMLIVDILPLDSLYILLCILPVYIILIQNKNSN